MVLHKLFDAVSRRGPVLILTPFISTIGNCSENIYFGLINARRTGKKLLILFPFELPWKFRFAVTNRELLDIESPYRWLSNRHPLVLVGRFLLTVLYAPMRVLSRLLDRFFGKPLHQVYAAPAIGLTTLWQPREDMREFSWSVVDSYRWPGQLNTYLPLGLRESKRLQAEKIRWDMGIPKDGWFACLHVREGGFHNDHQAAACRNASIRNYVKGIRAIADAGGWVVRLGDSSMTRLPRMERVIDYPHMPFKSDLMDIYLIQECRFYVGTQSGPMDTALMFQKPHVMTNMQSWLYPYPQREGDLGLLKRVFSKSKNRFLSVGELFDEPWEAQHFHSLGDDYQMQENTEDEIHEAIQEFLNQWGKPPSRSALQSRCNEKRIARGREIISSPLLADHFDDIHNRYRLASRLESAHGSLGHGFLKRHWS